MQPVTRRLRFVVNPLIMAVALGLLAPDILGDEEDEAPVRDPKPATEGTATHADPQDHAER